MFASAESAIFCAFAVVGFVVVCFGAVRGSFKVSRQIEKMQDRDQ